MDSKPSILLRSVNHAIVRNIVIPNRRLIMEQKLKANIPSLSLAV